jgi:hypothetical protein
LRAAGFAILTGQPVLIDSQLWSSSFSVLARSVALSTRNGTATSLFTGEAHRHDCHRAQRCIRDQRVSLHTNDISSRRLNPGAVQGRGESCGRSRTVGRAGFSASHRQRLAGCKQPPSTPFPEKFESDPSETPHECGCRHKCRRGKHSQR